MQWMCGVAATLLAIFLAVVLPSPSIHAAQTPEAPTLDPQDSAGDTPTFPAHRNGTSQISTRPTMPYTVQPGETLLTIAARFSTTPAAIVELNAAAVANRIDVGQILMVPADAVVAAPQMTVPAMRSPRVNMVPPAPAPYAMSMGASFPASMASATHVSGMASGVPSAMSASPFAMGMSSETANARLTVGAPVAPRLGATTADAAPNARITGTEVMAADLRTRMSPLALAAVQVALDLNGTPYVYGGGTPSGFDCSGFAQYVMRRAGREIPRDLVGQYAAGLHPTPAQLEPGDLVFFQNTYDVGLSHVGVYLGNGEFIHAISEGSGVGISNVNEPYWVERWYGATRIQ
jgi:cell wall-associated NlpC family hydrolase